MNKKGFSLVELLGVLVILGILSVIAIFAYSRYKESAVQQAYETMIKDAASAAEEYFMSNINSDSVLIKTLVDEEFLSDTIDPRNSKVSCGGKVIKRNKKSLNKGELDIMELEVTLDCKNNKICRIYPSNKAC